MSERAYLHQAVRIQGTQERSYDELCYTHVQYQNVFGLPSEAGTQSHVDDLVMNIRVVRDNCLLRGFFFYMFICQQSNTVPTILFICQQSKKNTKNLFSFGGREIQSQQFYSFASRAIKYQQFYSYASTAIQYQQVCSHALARAHTHTHHIIHSYSVYVGIQVMN